jgi:hypothetical protein
VFQLGTLPLSVALTPVWNNVVDVVVGGVLVALLGWHMALLPSFVIELLPMADLFPTWTAAVFLITRGRKRDAAQP